MTITEDDTGSLILKIHGGMEILTEQDEAALLARLLDRAGGLQNLWVEESTNMDDWAHTPKKLTHAP